MDISSIFIPGFNNVFIIIFYWQSIFLSLYYGKKDNLTALKATANYSNNIKTTALKDNKSLKTLRPDGLRSDRVIAAV